MTQDSLFELLMETQDLMIEYLMMGINGPTVHIKNVWN